MTKNITAANRNKHNENPIDSSLLIVPFGGSAKIQEPNKQLQGGKGASLLKMTSMDLRVPPGFILTTESYRSYQQNAEEYKKSIESSLRDSIAHIEEAVGRTFGDASDPLLVSVRSGAAISMPGMMDTILNLGLTSQNVVQVAARQGEKFAYSSFLRLISQFTALVLQPESNTELEAALDMGTPPADAAEAKERTERALALLTELGTPFPQDVWEQLWSAVETVFCSWNNERAMVYRNLQNIPHDIGTACTVMAMVFGNRSDKSGTGVCFSRDPSTGELGISGEYLTEGQGEDVVAGIRTPAPIALEFDPASLKSKHPAIFTELCESIDHLETQFRDMVDVEFTIEDEVLYFLQCRAAKRSATSALKIAVDMLEDQTIDEHEALDRITAQHIASLLRPSFHEEKIKKAKEENLHLADGLPAGPGAATGVICFNEADAPEATPWILVRRETSPEDVKGMSMAAGVLTVRGGMSSHAALVARQLGIVAVVGCEAAEIDDAAGTISFGETVLKAGEWISINGSTGAVYRGQIETTAASLSDPHAARILGIADQRRALQVRANADTVEQAERARSFGAEGIGLCRTEHMFFGEDRLPLVQQLILSRSEEERTAALKKLEALQEEDFYGILKAMDGCPVTVRTIDPPLHEFLPHGESEVQSLASQLSISVDELKVRISDMRENNPMLGFRGCRLGIVHPAIPKMQAWALSAAAARLKKEGFDPRPEIMIPLTSTAKELQEHRQALDEEIRKTEEKQGITLDLPIGTMIEVPRAAVTAGEIAQHADFLSFGTNDLTQLTFGLSRDDASAFLPHYLERDIFHVDPFVSVDRDGVGFLMNHAVEAARKAKPGMKIGICGEHGGDPDSIALCQELGLTYVSCSPFRVPVARLAAGQVV